jgi:hypothetical protein
MMISTPSHTVPTACSCGDDTCCHTGSLERPRFFPRQIVTAAELNLEHEYQRDRGRRHNRMLHGWGVVCGAEVCHVADAKGQPERWKVAIRPGFVLGPCGDEIVIDCERVVDLRTSGLICMAGMPSGEVSDPWCGDVRVERPGTVCIGIQYREFQARPVRVHPIGCGCGGDDCEYSRWRDGYEIGLLPECPDKGHRPKRRRVIETEAAPIEATPMPPMLAVEDTDWRLELERRGIGIDMRHRIFACPPCPDDPWVVLACVTLDGNGNVDIDECGCRRYVVSASAVALRCLTPTRKDDYVAPDWVAIDEPIAVPEAPEASTPAKLPEAVKGSEGAAAAEAEPATSRPARTPSRTAPKPASRPKPLEEATKPRPSGGQPRRSPTTEAKPQPGSLRKPRRRQP